MRSLIAALMLSATMASEVFFKGKDDGGDDYVETCWVKAYGRGAGVEPKYCDPSLDLSKGKCYEPCEVNYQGNGQTCYERCPWYNYKDDGLYCEKPASYGRGAGSVTECEDCE